MMKNMFSKAKIPSRTALAVLGWLAFVAGLSIDQPLGLMLALLSAARVLP